MPTYKQAVVDGHPHPLNIEYDEWHFVWIGFRQIGMQAIGSILRTPGSVEHFSEDEIELVGKLSREPQVEWAIDNSFDGLYIKRYEDLQSYTMVYKLGCYLQGKHATFWKLKYGHL